MNCLFSLIFLSTFQLIDKVTFLESKVDANIYFDPIAELDSPTVFDLDTKKR